MVVPLESIDIQKLPQAKPTPHQNQYCAWLLSRRAASGSVDTVHRGMGVGMTDKKTELSIAGQSFEGLKQVNAHGAEYWSARDLQPLLGYSQWRRFEQAIERAIGSCQASGNPPDHHFAGAGKMIDLGKGGQRDVDDYHLSRFACYLIAQNGDPRKPEIASAQKYFALQTRRQELSDQAAADQERLELRKQTSEEFKALSGAAQDAGVQNRMSFLPRWALPASCASSLPLNCAALASNSAMRARRSRDCSMARCGS
jgi:hypothetical protein